MSSSSILLRPVVTPSCVRFMSSSLRGPWRVLSTTRPTLAPSPRIQSIFRTVEANAGNIECCATVRPRALRNRKVWLRSGGHSRQVRPHRLLERHHGRLAIRLAANRAVSEIAHGAVEAMARIGVEHHLALRPHVPHDARRHLLGEIVGALHAPELRHHQVRFHVLEASRSDSPQMMHADDAVAEVALERGEHATEERRVLLVEQPARRVTHEPEARPHEQRATSRATTGSSQAHPVRLTRPRPSTMPPLVQTSASTCWPSAAKVSERCRRPVRSRYTPRARLTRAEASTMRIPTPI